MDDTSVAGTVGLILLRHLSSFSVLVGVVLFNLVTIHLSNVSRRYEYFVCTWMTPWGMFSVDSSSCKEKKGLLF